MESRFSPAEAPISGIHRAMAEGRLSCEELTDTYLRRIEELDRRGNALNAVIAINPHALDTARRLDRAAARSGPTGPSTESRCWSREARGKTRTIF